MNSVSLHTNRLVFKYKDSKGRNTPSMNQCLLSPLLASLSESKNDRGMVSSDHSVL